MKRTFPLFLSFLLSFGLLNIVTPGTSAVSLALPTSSYSAPLKQQAVLGIAHRGAARSAPENTIPAFDRAVAMKADFLELDIHASKDGTLVVLHDTTVDRTTDGKGAVKDMTLAELRRLDAGSKFNPSFKGTSIPTLEEVLTRYSKQTGLLIELKAPSRYPGIEQKLALLLLRYKLDQPGSRIIVQSFDSSSLALFHQYLPSVPTGVLIDKSELLNEPQLLRYTAFASYLNLNKKLVTKPLVARLHEFGLKVFPWSIRSPQEIPPLLATGVDGLITDDLTWLPQP